MERDIKANKNEITNIELRYTSALLATDRKTSLKEIALILAREERNSVIPSTKKSVDYEKIEKQLTSIERLISKLSN